VLLRRTLPPQDHAAVKAPHKTGRKGGDNMLAHHAMYVFFCWCGCAGNGIKHRINLWKTRTFRLTFGRLYKLA
jgi:hypothetical protein